MLLSVSRRTDIPAWYADWFFRRLAEGFALVPSPRAPHRLHQISLNPDVVDGIVFWTKNPLPMLPRLKELEHYLTVFQFTLTGYSPEAEPALPDKDTVLIPAFQRLSRALGPRRVIWRYDPIFFTREYTEEWHLVRFEQIARRLQGYTETCVISFLDEYQGTRARMRPLIPAAFDPQTAAAWPGVLLKLPPTAVCTYRAVPRRWTLGRRALFTESASMERCSNHYWGSLCTGPPPKGSGRNVAARPVWTLASTTPARAAAGTATPIFHPARSRPTVPRMTPVLHF